MEKMYGQTGADTEKLCLKKGKKRPLKSETYSLPERNARYSSNDISNPPIPPVLPHNVSYVVFI